MALVVEAAEFAQPEAVAQAGAAFGEVLGGGFAVGVGEGLGSEFGGRPVLWGRGVCGS